MELYHLRSFIAVAEEQSITRAAERIFSTPPSVSAHIKALEEEWKVALFTRSTRGMTLTEPGSRLLDKAQKVLAATDALAHQASALQEVISGELAIGINANPSYLRTGALATAIHRQYPHLKVNFITSMSGISLGRIQQETLDAAFVFGTPPSEYGQICAVWLDRVDLVMVAPKRWEAEVVNASWQQLAELPRISTNFYCPFDAVGDRLFQQHGLTSRSPAVKADDDQTKLELAIAEMGIAVLAKDDVESAVREGKVVAFEPAPMQTDLHFIYQSRRSNEPAIRAIRNELLTIWKPPLISPHVNGVHH